MTAPSLQERSRVVDAGSYRVLIGAGLRHEFATHIAAVARAHRYAVVSDSNVAPHYAATLVESLRVLGATTLHVVPAGESHKTREQWARLTDEMLDAGCGRDSTVVALGGGVVGDLAGFVAATFMRGVPVVQCPTSLLAMIDASIGGKTGVDTVAGKNLVGAFHPPAMVLADVDTLRTLPEAHRRAGLAEAIKHGIVADAGYLERISVDLTALVAGDPAVTLDCVTRSVKIKSEVVTSDTHERGRRKILNFGHTLGHAVEQVSGYALLHGEAVAIGMVIEARLAEQVGIAEPGTSSAIERVVARAGLPTMPPASLNSSDILRATKADKKTRAGSVEYALPSRIGSMAGAERGWAVPVDDSAVLAVLGKRA
jgi:3-dehydroquinate synthase